MANTRNSLLATKSQNSSDPGHLLERLRAHGLYSCTCCIQLLYFLISPYCVSPNCELWIINMNCNISAKWFDFYSISIAWSIISCFAFLCLLINIFLVFILEASLCRNISSNQCSPFNKSKLWLFFEIYDHLHNPCNTIY